MKYKLESIVSSSVVVTMDNKMADLLREIKELK